MLLEEAAILEAAVGAGKTAATVERMVAVHERLIAIDADSAVRPPARQCTRRGGARCSGVHQEGAAYSCRRARWRGPRGGAWTMTVAAQESRATALLVNLGFSEELRGRELRNLSGGWCASSPPASLRQWTAV